MQPTPEDLIEVLIDELGLAEMMVNLAEKEQCADLGWARREIQIAARRLGMLVNASSHLHNAGVQWAITEAWRAIAVAQLGAARARRYPTDQARSLVEHYANARYVWELLRQFYHSRRTKRSGQPREKSWPDLWRLKEGALAIGRRPAQQIGLGHPAGGHDLH